MKKIVVLGPESTGKSSLCAALAAYYQTLWVPEYARNYLLQHGTAYAYNTLLHIAQGQLALEQEYAGKLDGGQQTADDNQPSTVNAQLLIIDTNQYVMKVWCEVVFNQCHPWILQQAAAASYDLYLLCDVDLPWVQDGLREYPDLEMRRRLFLEYKDILINDGTPWGVVSGTDAERLQNAINIINQHLHQ